MGGRNLPESFSSWFEKYLIFFVVGGLIGGIAVASFSQPLVDRVDSIINLFMDLYSFIAPIAIFLILAPSLARLFSTRSMGRFGLFVIRWYAVRKLLACLWAIVFILMVFRIPILPQGSLSLAEGLVETMKSLGVMASTSSYFWAMYAAVIVALSSMRVHRLSGYLEKILSGLESAGSYLMPVMPIFMFAIGAYIYGLPENVQEQVGLGAEGRKVLTDLNIWGWSIAPASSGGMIVIYVLGAILTAIACFIWQFGFLLVTRRHEARFSITSYFRDYLIKVYPLLWATSSEALATPLNLYLTKKYAPWIRRDVRRFIIGVGSYMNINGTLINVFILGTIVLLILGLNISVVELLLIVPVVFLISYGVPGIPGELVLFAGPMATLLAIPEDVLPVFLAVYLGLQIGLPDSFRTGNNSTDDYIGSVMMNAVYEKRYAAGAEREESVLKEATEGSPR
jgi:Na+/H+-dicarboxylate symporter